MGRSGVVVLMSFVLAVGLILILSCGGGGGGRDSRLVFNASDGSGRELWVLDKNGSLEMVDIDATSGASPGPFSKFDNKLYFRARDADHGDELWVYDGVNAPTMVANINTDDTNEFGSWPGEELGSKTNDMVVYKGRFYFAASTSEDRWLWVYDGSGSPSVASTAFTDPRYIVEYDDKLFFRASDVSEDQGLWSFDGSSAAVAASVGGNYFTVYDGKLYFMGNDVVSGYELWVYDAASGTAEMVTDIWPGGDSSSPSELTVFEDRLYFPATDDTHGRGLHVFDSKSGTAQMLTDLNVGGSSYPAGLTVYDGSLYFSADDGSDTTLWKYNGIDSPSKVAGARTVEFYSGNLTAVFNGKLYFNGYSAEDGWEPRVYDGISAPSILADINSAGDSDAWQFFVY
jgi:ELWxxDGT repeat protein